MELAQKYHSQSIIPDLACMLSNNSMACMFSDNSELCLSKLIQDHLSNEYISAILNQAEILFSEIIDIADSINILIDKLITLLIKTHEEGNSIDETKHFINHCISLSNQTSNDIFEWLEKNQIKSSYIFFLGFFYYNEFTLEDKNDDKAFKLFLEAANNNYPIAQVYISIFYNYGIGT